MPRAPCPCTCTPTTRLQEGQANDKTEAAWHILEAVSGASALCGVRQGVAREQLHRALLDQDFEAVLRRLPVRAGETICVPGGALHSFGPDTLVFEIEQTSDVQQHAMGWAMEDGSAIPESERASNVQAVMDHVVLEGPADVLVGCLPDLRRDVIDPLAAAGHSRQLIAELGEGLGPGI